MSMTDDWSRTARRRESASAQPDRVRLGGADVLLQLWRVKWSILLIFLVVFGVGLLATLLAPKTFTAQSRLLVSSAQDSAAQVNAEMELIRGPLVVERTLEKFPLARIFPDLAEACEAKRMQMGASAQVKQLEYACRHKAVEVLSRNFRVSAVPSTPVITVSMAHKDPEIAAEVLNALIGAYFAYRAEIYGDLATLSGDGQSDTSGTDLKQAEEALRLFLVTNEMGSFEAERDTLSQLYQLARSELLKAETRTQQVEGQLAAYRRQIKSTASKQDIFVEDTPPRALLDLKMERAQSLTRYPANSQIIKDMDRRIAAAEAYLNTSGASGTVRRGPNPLYQEIEVALSALAAEAESLGKQQAELRRQIADIEARQLKLTELEPAYRDLVRKRDSLAQAVFRVSESEHGYVASSGVSSLKAGEVRVLEPARVPFSGTSLRWPVLAIAALFAGLLALGIGMLRTMNRKVFSTTGAVQRTLKVPVVATVQHYR